MREGERVTFPRATCGRTIPPMMEQEPGMENGAFHMHERDASSRDVSGRTLTVALAFVLIVFVVLMIALVVR